MKADTRIQPSQAHIDEMKTKALAALARTDGIAADSAEFIRFEDLRYGGQYVILRSAGELAAVYKVQARLGSPKLIPGGGGATIVDSLSFGVKRIKRPPKGLI